MPTSPAASALGRDLIASKQRLACWPLYLSPLPTRVPPFDDRTIPLAFGEEDKCQPLTLCLHATQLTLWIGESDPILVRAEQRVGEACVIWLRGLPYPHDSITPAQRSNVTALRGLHVVVLLRSPVVVAPE